MKILLISQGSQSIQLIRELFSLGYKPTERNGKNRYKQLQNIKKSIITKAKDIIEDEDLI